MVSLHVLASKIGQAASVMGSHIAKFAKDPVDHVRRGFLTVKTEAILFKQLLTLSSAELKDAIAHTNEIMQALCFGNGEGVIFHMRHFDPDSPLWQKSVRIACYRINFANRSARVTRTLNLRQFWVIKQDIIEQTQFRLTKNEPTDFRETPAASEQGDTQPRAERQEEPINAQAILHRVDVASEQEECCICMENGYEVSLPCAHSFCKSCIEEWNDTHQTCPMCRNQITSNDEFWEMEGAPNQEEFGQYVLRLAAGS